MYRSIVHNKDFEVSLAYESEELLPPGVTSPVFAQYAVLGLSDAAEKYELTNSFSTSGNYFFACYWCYTKLAVNSGFYVGIILFSRYSSKNLSSPIKANLHFSLSRSGILSLDRADAVVEFSEWVEVPRKNLTVENSTTASPNVSLEANTTTEESIDKATIDSATSSTNNTTVEEKGSEDVIPEKKLKKRTFRVPLKV